MAFIAFQRLVHRKSGAAEQPGAADLLPAFHLLGQHAVQELLLPGRRLRLAQLDGALAEVYCAVGETAEIVQSISKRGLRVYEFVYTVSPERRKEVLQQFDRGDIQILVAIKCLDEGVNIPATREAFFLANTTNPREFVQRRGRILRKSKGKHEALLHDFVVILNSGMSSNEEIDEKILRRKCLKLAIFRAPFFSQPGRKHDAVRAREPSQLCRFFHRLQCCLEPVAPGELLHRDLLHRPLLPQHL